MKIFDGLKKKKIDTVSFSFGKFDRHQGKCQTKNIFRIESIKYLLENL